MKHEYYTKTPFILIYLFMWTSFLNAYTHGIENLELMLNSVSF